MNKKVINRYKLNKILFWCVYKYGINKEKDDYPTLILHKSKSFLTKRYIPKNNNKKEYDKILLMKGEYDETDNIIHIYAWANKDIKDFCQTIIHEYQHYLETEKMISQSEDKDLDIKAEFIAQKDFLVCLQDLKINQ